MQTPKALAFAELTAYVYTNEAVLILEDVREGKSVAGATMIIDRGRREEANRMRLELGNDVFMEFIESWADHYYEELAEIKKSKPVIEDDSNQAPKHVIGRRGCKRCGLPAGSPFDCKPLESMEVDNMEPSSTEALGSLDTTHLRNISKSMSTGTMADEQKTLLMKIEKELARRAVKDMEPLLEDGDIDLLKAFVHGLMENHDSHQELDAYDFERHAIAMRYIAENDELVID